MNDNYLFSFLLYFLIAGCNSHQKPSESYFPKNFDEVSQIKYVQYIIQGKILYRSNCSHCHQHSGEGFRKLYPALIKSATLMGNIGSAACLIKYGTKRSEKSSNLNILMPAQSELSNLEIAEILTYIGNSWGNQIGFISVNNVSKYLVDCTPN
jgi:cytochrome c